LNNGQTLTMVRIPAVPFLKGSPEQDRHGNGWEWCLHHGEGAAVEADGGTVTLASSASEAIERLAAAPSGGPVDPLLVAVRALLAEKPAR
jgi:hypothetical protein